MATTTRGGWLLPACQLDLNIVRPGAVEEERPLALSSLVRLRFARREVVRRQRQAGFTHIVNAEAQMVKTWPMRCQPGRQGMFSRQWLHQLQVRVTQI